MTAPRPISAGTTLALAAIVLAAFLLFHPVLSFGYTNWDDDIHITNNPAVQVMDREHVMALFLPTDRYMYHPVTMLSYMAEWAAAPNDPALPHAVNLSLHLLNIVLVFFVVRSLSRSDAGALFITALFALHPLQTESVAWISARKDLLSAAFLLSALVLYHRWKREGDAVSYGSTLLLFITAILAKPSAVILPVLIIVLDNLRGAWDRRSGMIVIPMSLIAVVAAWFHTAIAPAGAVKPFLLFSLPQRIMMIGYELVFYPMTLLSPSALSAFYGYPIPQNGFLPVPVIAGAAVALVSAVFVVWQWKRIPWIRTGIIWYLVTIAPVLQILPFTNASLTADRYAYLAMIGLLLLITEWWEHSSFRQAAFPPVVTAAAILIIVGMLRSSAERLPVWTGSIPLFTDVLAHRPDAVVAYGNRANALVREGRFTEAIADCDRLLQLSPGEPKAYYNRGNALLGLERFGEADQDLQRSVDGGFRTAGVFYQLSRCAAARGDMVLQTELLDSALQIDPVYRDAVIDRIASAVWEGQFETGVQIAHRYLRTVPDDPDVLMWSARLNLRHGWLGDALEESSRSLSLRSSESGSRGLIDSIDAAVIFHRKEIARQTTLIDAGGAERKKNLLRRASLYDAVGDDIRAGQDRKQAAEVTYE